MHARVLCVLSSFCLLWFQLFIHELLCWICWNAYPFLEAIFAALNQACAVYWNFTATLRMLCSLQSSRIYTYSRVVRCKPTDVLLAICFMLVSCLVPSSTLEITSDMFFRNINWIWAEYTALYAEYRTLHNHLCENSRSYITWFSYVRVLLLCGGRYFMLRRDHDWVHTQTYYHGVGKLLFWRQWPRGRV